MDVLKSENFSQKSRINVKKVRGLALIGSPLLFTASEIVHPESQTDTVKELTSVATNITQWYVAHMLALFAIILLPFAVSSFLDYLDGRLPYLGHTAAGLTSTGIIAVAGLVSFDLITWQMAAVGPNQEMIALYDRVTQSPGYSLPFLIIGPLLLVLGLLMFSVALYVSKAIKRWQSVLMGIGIFLYGFAGPVFPVSNGILLVISGAVMMTIGLGTLGFKTFFAKSRSMD